MAQATAGLGQEASVTSGNGVPYPRTTASPVPKSPQYHYLPRPSSDAHAPARTRPRAKSASNLLNRSGQDVEFHDDTFIDQQQRQQEPGKPHDGLAELIDFLRNHSPPSGNFMSIPDHIAPGDRGRWHRIRKLGKRTKSISKSPQTIRLPDSAVSGTTIGGHRHIAISIPLDASPFGRTPRSQYPVYQHRNVKPLTSQYSPTRAVLNEKGVVTVLRTVTEDRESTPSVSPANSQFLLSTIPQASPNTANGGSYLSGTINSSNHAKTPENLNVLAAPPLRVLTPDQVRQANEQSREFQNHDQGGLRPVSLSSNGKVPSWNPSLTGSRFVHLGDLSIGTMMSQPTTTETHPTPTSPARPVSKDGSYQPSLSKSIMTASENDPVVGEARPVEAKSMAARESHIRSSTKRPESPITVITKSPLRVSRTRSKKKVTEDPRFTPELSSSQSRREKVKDKKRRDMEAASLKRRSMVFAPTDLKSEDLERDTIKELPEDDAERPPPLPKRSPQRQSICPIMVVANVNPSPPPSSGLPDYPEKTPSSDFADARPILKTSASENFIKRGAKSWPIPPSPASYMNGSPTPPQSAHGSPTHKQSSQDRTSLSRRREWNAARDGERKRKDIATNTSPQPRARRTASKEEAEDAKSPAMEKEMLRRYEAYREYRIREMERRVRRLERNGDVWLRALVPVLDNLNRTLAHAQGEQHRRAQGWVSDDEQTRHRNSSQTRPSSRGRMMARPGTSERDFLEQLVRTKEELEAGSVSDDMSGFDTIEPLMRELAGRSRLSFEARSLGMDDDRLLQSYSD
ncbi:hypothetical protein F66182_8066 [Fusarium sp. NRRL 66182]|nr:hypothetical protein F66182_8066 [Fusarium sp. NRRL 66182]